VLGNYILSQPTVLVDTNGYNNQVNICSSLHDYDDTVTIDNSVLNNFDTLAQTEDCGDTRCSRCVATVSPCNDLSTYISWVYTPQAGFTYDVGDVYYGSNINGYITNTNYTVDISCVVIVSSTTANEGTMYTVTDVDTTNPYYGTQTEMTNGCDCRTGVIVENSYGNSTGRGDGTNILYSWYNCNGTTLQTHQLNAGQSVVTYYTIPGCIDITTLTWSSTLDPGAGIDNEGDCCNGAT